MSAPPEPGLTTVEIETFQERAARLQVEYQKRRWEYTEGWGRIDNSTLPPKGE
jgi:hypothetical protein